MSEDDSPIPVDGEIRFYRRDRASFGFLSNFYQAAVTIDGVGWPTTEHYYQAQKSFDPAYREAVKAAETPGRAKRLGTDPSLPLKRSGGSWFRTNGKTLRRDWNEVKLVVMRTALRAKFGQNASLAAALAATGQARIVEDSRFDAFWGIGPGGDGENWLGRLLEEIRSEIRAQGVALVGETSGDAGTPAAQA